MNDSLPTVEELEKLPLRAVVAYAARTARRLSEELRGIVADDILDDALRLIDTVSTTYHVGEIDKASVIRAAGRIATAYAAAPADLKSAEKFLVVFSMTHAAEAAMFALLAAAEPGNAVRWRKDAVEEAQRTVCCIRVLSSEAAPAARKAARRDYEIMLQAYGEHDEVVLGNPVDCFGDE